MNELVFPDTQTKEIRRKAMDLLARREHSLVELRRKLYGKGYDEQIVDAELQKLAHERLLSDERFAESYVNFRSKKGFGPLRIKQELKEKGVSETLINAVMDNDTLWQALAEDVREKRFGGVFPQDYKEKAKQMRFLQYRGFTNEQLRQLFDNNE